MKTSFDSRTCVFAGLILLAAAPVLAQLVDRNTATNALNEGIAKTYTEEIGAGRGDTNTPNSSLYIINRDPFRAVRRGRQLFQRKFTRAQGQGPVTGDGAGNINTDLAIGAGLSDSCAGCHGRPRGSAGFGGDVVTRPDSRDAPHLFGLGIKEMLADEITQDLRAIRDKAMDRAKSDPVRLALISKGISYGYISATKKGTVVTVDTSEVQGVDTDLRVRPFFAHGGTISIREFVIGALNNEMGLQAVDPDTLTASGGGKVTTPSGMVLDGSKDAIEAPHVQSATDDADGDGVVNEVPVSIVDFFEFYLLNYFKPGTYQQTFQSGHGRRLMDDIGCTTCHIANLTINRDRRVADVETVYDPTNGVFNNLFATASLLSNFSGTAFNLVSPDFNPFEVRNIFTDLKRHDLGPNFYERNYDGTTRKQFMTLPLWGVGSSAPYGHDGRSVNLMEVILRHGGEAASTSAAFAARSDSDKEDLIAFLNTLVLFPPDDTASNLNPANRNAAGFPQSGHGSIRLAALFRIPSDPE